MKKDEVNTQEVQEVQEVQPERVPITIPRGDKRDDSNLFVDGAAGGGRGGQAFLGGRAAHG